MSRRMAYDFCIFTASKNINKFFRSFGTSLSSSAEVVVVGQSRGNKFGIGFQVLLAERSFDLRTSGLWAQHASTAPLCSACSVSSF